MEALPRPPKELSKEAKKEWRKTGKLLLDAGLLSDLDLNTFAMYCQTYGRWLEAVKEVNDKGQIIRAPSGYPMVNPFMTIEKQCLSTLGSLLQEFGLSPSSRTRVAAVAQESTSNLERFLASV